MVLYNSPLAAHAAPLLALTLLRLTLAGKPSLAGIGAQAIPCQSPACQDDTARRAH